MKKAFKLYVGIWAVLLILFNVISFVSPGWAGVGKYTSSFWTGYVFISLAFIGQFICTFFALKDDDVKKTFYNISLVTTSYTGLILSFVFGGFCMLISTLPYWIGILLCAFVLGINAISVIKAFAAVEIVSDVDKKVKENTMFVKSMTLDAESLMNRAESDSVKQDCKKVYEALRYSDPVSNPHLALVESRIEANFSEFSNAVSSGDSETVSKLAGELVILIDERSRKCKLLK